MWEGMVRGAAKPTEVSEEGGSLPAKEWSTDFEGDQDCEARCV